MSDKATAGELLESLDRHFLAGCPSLSTIQLREHEQDGTCYECRQRAPGILGAFVRPAPSRQPA
jgi:hypothetical protein